MTAPYDGIRVTDRTSSVYFAGYHYQANTQMRVQALNPTTNTWVTIATATTAATQALTFGGTPLYLWQVGNRTLSNTYWATGTNGYFARTRAQTLMDGTWQPVFNTRVDNLACFLEQPDINGIASNCFSHRAETHIYTQNYSIAPAGCPEPTAATPKKNNHYMLANIPACAQQVIFNRMGEKVSAAFVDSHYQIEHNSGPSAHATTPVTIGTRTYTTGGFFGGHDVFIRNVKRHVMVYDYAWMRQGEIPSWDPSTTIPTTFRNSIAAPNGSCLSSTPSARGPNCCDSQTASCTSGWYSGIVYQPTPNLASRPAGIANLCSITTASALHSQVNGWHGQVHCTVGNGSFGSFSNPRFAEAVFCSSFDNPSFPLFFLWHNHVNDIWVDWKACGHPIP